MKKKIDYCIRCGMERGENPGSCYTGWGSKPFKRHWFKTKKETYYRHINKQDIINFVTKPIKNITGCRFFMSSNIKIKKDETDK